MGSAFSQSKGGRSRRLAFSILFGFALACASANETRTRVTGDPAPVRSHAVAASDAVPQSWLARARRDIAAREYETSLNSRGLQAPNRRHDLRTYFGPTGIRVHDRTAEDDSELLRLALVGMGRGDSLPPVGPGEVANSGARVEIRRPGLVEWYVNSPQGLEQGFTLSQRPQGQGALALDLAVEPARAARVGERIVLTTPVGRRLAYGKLAVVDADGTPVEASLEVPTSSRIRVVVRDRDARYPIVIDPLLTSTPDARIEGDREDAELGYSVAGAGDVDGDGYDDAIVGAPGYDAGSVDEGAAFVFRGGPAGIADGGPASAATLLRSEQRSARFGSSVAGAGDVDGDGYDDVVVGAWEYDSGEEDEGAAFVFLGGPSGIPDGTPATAATRLESNQSGSRFGWDVAGAGDVDGDGYDDLIVGAFYYAFDGVPSSFGTDGSAFVFLGSESGIPDGSPETAASWIEPESGSDWMGYAVDGAGDVNGDGYDDVLVSAPRSSFQKNRVFVFHGSASGIVDGHPEAAATSIEAVQRKELGLSLAGAGDVNGDGYDDVILGALGDAIDKEPFGAAFVVLGGAFGLPSGKVDDVATRLRSDRRRSWLGRDVSGAGDVNDDGYDDVVVGAYGYGPGGAAFVFLGGPSGIAEQDVATAAARIEADRGDAALGWSVAGVGDLDGDGYDDVMAGGPQYGAAEIDQGVAVVLLGSGLGVPDGDPETASAQLESDQVGARLGWSVAGAGDVNGDGYDDVIVGADLYDAGEPEEGAAFVFLGSDSGVADGHPVNAATRLEADQAWAGMGRSVAGAGDVDGDGYDDVIVGADAYDAGERDEGAAFLFRGSPTGIADGTPASAATRLEANQPWARMGWSVAGAGDIDDDGYDDVIVGAVLYDAGQGDEGAAFVFRGGAGGIADGSPATASTRIESDQAQAFLGQSVSSAGDVNGDGFDDVIVGADAYDAGEENEGAAFVFLGSDTGVPDATAATAASRLESDQPWAGFGRSVAGAGDVDGDGYDDVIVGADAWDAGHKDAGAAFVFPGSAAGVADGTPASAATRIEADQKRARLGGSVAGAGDIDGDGYDDVIVGADAWDTNQKDAGAAFVFAGSAAGIADGTPATATTRIVSDQAGAALGASVAAAGDVDGDGDGDVIVGAPGYAADRTDEGAAFVYLGNSPTPISRILEVPATYATVQEAVDQAMNGDTIYVTESLGEPETVVIDGFIGLEIVGAGRPVLDGAAETTLVIRESRRVTIAGLELVNDRSAAPVVEIRGSHDVRLEYTTVGPGGGVGVSIVDSEDSVLSNLTIRSIGDRCVDLGHSAGDAFVIGGRIERSRFQRCGAGGLRVSGSGLRVDRNTFDAPSGDAIALDGGSGHRVLDNTVTGASANAIRVGGDENLVGRNTVRKSGDSGILVTGAGNRFTRNDVRKSAGCDLRDDSGGDTNVYRKNRFGEVCE